MHGFTAAAVVTSRQVTFTAWKNFSRSLRRTRLCNEQIHRQQHKQNNTEMGAMLLHRPPLDLPHEAQAKWPRVAHVKATNSARCVRPSSSRPQQWITQYPREASLRGRGRERSATTSPVQSAPCSRSRRRGGNDSTDLANSTGPGPRPLAPFSAAPTRRPSGKGVVLRTGNDLRAGSSRADHHGKSGQRERQNIRVVTCVCCDRRNQKSRERDCSRGAGPGNRTQTTQTTGHAPKDRANTATPHFAPSPFLVGGPLCAKYPSPSTTAKVSVFNMAKPKPLIAWAATAASEPGVRQQMCSTLGSVPRGSGSWKRRGVDTTSSARHNSSPPKHRRTYCSEAITSEEAYLLSCMGTAYPHGLYHHRLPVSEAAGTALVSTSAAGKALQILPGQERAPTGPSRCTTNTACTAVDEIVDVKNSTGGGHVACSCYLPRHQGRIVLGEGGGEEPWETSCRNMCFGQYRLLVG